MILLEIEFIKINWIVKENMIESLINKFVYSKKKFLEMNLILDCEFRIIIIILFNCERY